MHWGEGGMQKRAQISPATTRTFPLPLPPCAPLGLSMTPRHLCALLGSFVPPVPPCALLLLPPLLN